MPVSRSAFDISCTFVSSAEKDRLVPGDTNSSHSAWSFHRALIKARLNADGSWQVHERERRDSIRALIAGRRAVSYVQLALDLRRVQTSKLEAYAARRSATLAQVQWANESGDEALVPHIECTESMVLSSLSWGRQSWNGMR